ncbi:hypothetical protein VNO80_11645 [Phaseolus coccineus]|uniref:Uncharacterized protein n=1 Tax=Phaseolus coccineus TaxID=3886 RepID=A0AAN9RKM8_PHACN
MPHPITHPRLLTPLIETSFTVLVAAKEIALPCQGKHYHRVYPVSNGAQPKEIERETEKERDWLKGSSEGVERERERERGFGNWCCFVCVNLLARFEDFVFGFCNSEEKRRLRSCHVV